MAMLVRIIPMARFRGTDCEDMDSCKSPTVIILKAPIKHLAILSKYLSMNDTRRPHAARTTIVAYAAKLNPWKGSVSPLVVLVSRERKPKQTPKK